MRVLVFWIILAVVAGLWGYKTTEKLNSGK